MPCCGNCAKGVPCAAGCSGGCGGLGQSLGGSPYFEVRSGPAGQQYRALTARYMTAIQVALVAWQLVPAPPAAVGHHPEKPLPAGTEVVSLVPHVVTGPKDTGDAGRWVRSRQEAGKGILLLPPAGWKPSGNMQDIAGESMTAIATDDFSQVLAHAIPSRPGFVVYEPQGGWKGGSVAPPVAPRKPAKPAAAGRPLVYAGVAAAALGLWWLYRSGER